MTHSIIQKDYSEMILSLERLVRASKWTPDIIFGISRGGIIPGNDLATKLKVTYKTISPFTEVPEEYMGKDVLFVDDIYDSGATIKHFTKQLPSARVAVLYKRKESQAVDYFAELSSLWIQFPWESSNDESGGMKQGVVTLLRGIGEDPLREGLLETPKRVEKAYKELTKGYSIDIKSLFKTFSSEGYDQIVMCKDIPFYSLCEHHMLPFWGKMHIAYIPKKKIIGLSKLARIGDAFARRLQVQERLTQDISDAINEHLDPQGVAVVIEGQHMCMRMRGIEKEGVMKTSKLTGVFMKKGEARQELFDML